MSDEGPEVALYRIETCTVELLDGLASATFPDLEVPRFRRGRRRGLSVVDGSPQPAADQQASVAISQVYFMARQGARANRYARIIQMLTDVHEVVRTGRKAPQRDIFYQLKGGPLSTAPSHVADALKWLVGEQISKAGAERDICCIRYINDAEGAEGLSQCIHQQQRPGIRAPTCSAMRWGAMD